MLPSSVSIVARGAVAGGLGRRVGKRRRARRLDRERRTRRGYSCRLPASATRSDRGPGSDRSVYAPTPRTATSATAPSAIHSHGGPLLAGACGCFREKPGRVWPCWYTCDRWGVCFCRLAICHRLRSCFCQFGDRGRIVDGAREERLAKDQRVCAGALGRHDCVEVGRASGELDLHPA